MTEAVADASGQGLPASLASIWKNWSLSISLAKSEKSIELDAASDLETDKIGVRRLLLRATARPTREMVSRCWRLIGATSL